MRTLPLVAVLSLVGCSGGDAPAPAPEVLLDPMPATAQLARASLDLLGQRPSLEDLEAVNSDPARYDELVEAYLEDPALEDRLVFLFQETLHTRSETFDIVDVETLPDPRSFVDAVGQEPLRLMAHVAVSDAPFTDVLLADWTYVDHHLAGVYPTDYPNGETGWKRVSYTDDRPAAGVLSTNGLYWRFPSTDSNKQRKRANQISRIFTCRDFLQTEIPFDDDIDLLNEEAVANAIQNNPSCAGCHDTLDPIASYLWGFSYGIDDGFALADGAIYHPERERSWQDETGTAPGWYGQNGSTLRDLGQQIAADPGFAKCTVDRALESLLRQPASRLGAEAKDPHEVAFITSGLRYKALLASIVKGPAYRSNADEEGVPSKKWMPPDLMASQIEALTGFRWTADRGEDVFDLLQGEAQGLLTLAGGLDGSTVTAAADRPNTTVLLVQDRLSTAAAAWTVERELDRADPRLFEVVSPDQVGSEAERREQIVLLRGRIHSVLIEPDAEEVDAYLELFDDVLALDDAPEAAWGAVLTAMFRDPDFAAY